MNASIRVSVIAGLVLLGLCGSGTAVVKPAAKTAAASEKPTVAVLCFEVKGKFADDKPGFMIASQLAQYLKGEFKVVDDKHLHEMLADDGLLVADLKDICRGRGGPGLLAAARKVRSVKYLVVASVSKNKKGLVQLKASMCDWQSGQTAQTRQATLEQEGWVDFVVRLPQFAAELTAGIAKPQAAQSKPLTITLKKTIGMTLRRIPAGVFTMGSRPHETRGGTDEGPPHEVTISKPFYMGVTEVTRAQWHAVMGSSPWGKYGAWDKDKYKDLPAAKISWENATEFCRKLSAVVGKTVRLPTEAEWEYACRAGSKTTFYYGDDPNYARLRHYALHGSAQPGHIPNLKTVAWHIPNAWGLHDMHGSAWEWCSDRYAPSYDKAAAKDPQGPKSGDNRVLRGGSQRSIRSSCRSANRHWAIPTAKGSHMGLRIVIPAERISK